MKRKLSLLATLLVVACSFVFTSCDDDPDMSAVPPSFSDLVIDPVHPMKGDSVHAVLKFKDKGQDWYKVNYTWTLYEQSWNSTRGQYEYLPVTGSNESYTLDMTEPRFVFQIPDTIQKNTFYRLQVVIKNVSAKTLFPPSGAIYSSATIDNSIVTFTAKIKEDE